MDFDDKDLVIVGAILIAIFAMYKIDDPVNVINQIMTGLFGVAVGKRL